MKVVERRGRARRSDFDLAFSAVEADVARELEPRLAKDIPVISAASAFRYDDDVPLLIPPVNADHAPLIARAAEAPRLQGLHRPHPQLHHHRPGHHPGAAGGSASACRR